MATQELLREESTLTQLAFSRLLQWLDDGTESHGETYLDIRQRLVSYFDRRNRPFPDDLADETLNRISRTLETDGAIAVTPPARYCYVVARFVMLEDIRHERRQLPIDHAKPMPHRLGVVGAADDRAAEHERRLECLDRCLGNLEPDQRDLAVEYYRDAKRQRIERRRTLAARLGISMNALGIRASRIRSTLESCVGACCRKRLTGFQGRRPIHTSKGDHASRA